jgi:hypothetical protein
MSFRETLEEHLRAIRGRDLPALVATLPADALVLITADGRLERSVSRFLELHRDWFAFRCRSYPLRQSSKRWIRR